MAATINISQPGYVLLRVIHCHEYGEIEYPFFYPVKEGETFNENEMSLTNLSIGYIVEKLSINFESEMNEQIFIEVMKSDIPILERP